MNAPSIKSRLRNGSSCVHSFIERTIVRTKTVKSTTRRPEKATPCTGKTGYQHTVQLRGTYTYNDSWWRQHSDVKSLWNWVLNGRRDWPLLWKCHGYSRQQFSKNPLAKSTRWYSRSSTVELTHASMDPAVNSRVTISKIHLLRKYRA